MRLNSIVAGISVAVFAWQTCSLARADCQNMDAAVCGPGNGTFSNVSGDIVLGRGGGITPAISGASILAGDRILVRSGVAQVSLGPSCSASVAAGSIATVTQQNNLTCLHGNVLPQAVGADLPTHKQPPPPAPVVEPAGFNPAWLLIPIAAGGIACAIWCWHHHEEPPPISP
jgi:hypothetical protein